MYNLKYKFYMNTQNKKFIFNYIIQNIFFNKPLHEWVYFTFHTPYRGGGENNGGVRRKTKKVLFLIKGVN